MDKIEIDEKKFKKELFREKATKLWNNILIFLEYLIREPYYEFKDLFSILSQNEVSLMYAAFILFLFFYNKGVNNLILSLLIIVIFISWIYGIYKSGEWEKYYDEKYKK